MIQPHYEIRARDEQEHEIVVGYVDGDPEHSSVVKSILTGSRFHAPRAIDVNELIARSFNE